MLALGSVCLSLTLLQFLLDMSRMFSSCSTMRVTIVALSHAVNSPVQSPLFVGLTRPKTPRLGGRARRFLSSFPGGLRPVRLGMRDESQSCGIL